MDVVEKIQIVVNLINNGNVVADGTFNELKTEKADTLEMLFAQLPADRTMRSPLKSYLMAFHRELTMDNLPSSS